MELLSFGCELVAEKENVTVQNVRILESELSMKYNTAEYHMCKTMGTKILQDTFFELLGFFYTFLQKLMLDFHLGQVSKALL